MAEQSMMTLVALGTYLPVTSTLSLFFRVDLLVPNRISPLLVNMEVGIGANSYFKTSLRFMSRSEACKPISVLPRFSKGQGAILKGHFSAVNGPSKGHFSTVNGPSKGHFSAVN